MPLPCRRYNSLLALQFATADHLHTGFFFTQQTSARSWEAGAGPPLPPQGAPALGWVHGGPPPPTKKGLKKEACLQSIGVRWPHALLPRGRPPTRCL